MFTPDQAEMQRAAINQAAVSMATLNLLMEKGIIKKEEWDSSYNQMLSILDQAVAEEKERQMKAFEDEHPGAAAILQMLRGSIDGT
jgi:hypothetical protein